MQDALLHRLKEPPLSPSTAIMTVTIPQNLAANSLFGRWGPVLARAQVWPSWELVHAYEKSFDWEPGKAPVKGRSIVDWVPGTV